MSASGGRSATPWARVRIARPATSDAAHEASSLGQHERPDRGEEVERLGVDRAEEERRREERERDDGDARRPAAGEALGEAVEERRRRPSPATSETSTPATTRRPPVTRPTTRIVERARGEERRGARRPAIAVAPRSRGTSRLSQRAQTSTQAPVSCRSGSSHSAALGIEVLGERVTVMPAASHRTARLRGRSPPPRARRGVLRWLARVSASTRRHRGPIVRR